MLKKILLPIIIISLVITNKSYGAFDSVTDNIAEKLEIIRITPSGKDVEKTRQIVFQFNQNVVPIGDMERKQEDLSINIKPKINCHWRWLNTTALACNLEVNDELNKATKYEITVNPGITTQNGQTLEKSVFHSFITQRPEERYTRFYSWKNPTLPSYSINFNHEVTKSSVAKHVFFESNGKRYNVNVEQKPEYYNYDIVNNEEISDKWLVYPAKNLDPDAQYTINIEPGLVSAYGPEKGVEEETLTKGFSLADFKFLGIECYDENHDDIFIQAGSDNEEHKCFPDHSIYLAFSAPVKELAEESPLAPKITYTYSNSDPWEDKNIYEGYSRITKDDYFKVSVPGEFKGLQKYTVTIKGINNSFLTNVKNLFNEKILRKEKEKTTEYFDIFGRPLNGIIKTVFYTSRRAPNLYFPEKEAVLEKDAKTDVAVFPTNIEGLELKGSILKADNNEDSVSFKIKTDQNPDTTIRTNLNTKKLIGDSGIFFGELFSKYFENSSDYNGRSDSVIFQRTPFNIIAKSGCSKSLVWVTDLDTGKAVSGAKVFLFNANEYDELKEDANIIEETVTDDNGIAILQNKAYDYENSIIVKKDNDIGFLKFNYDYNVDYGRCDDGTKFWGLTSQGIYRPEQIVKLKIFARDRQGYKLSIPNSNEIYFVTIEDPKGTNVFAKNSIELSPYGTIEAEYKIPKNASMGWYDIKVTEQAGDYSYAGRFLVTDFVPPSFKVKTSVDKDFYENGDTIKVMANAKLYSGGAYANAKTRTNIILNETIFRPSHPVSSKFNFYIPWNIKYFSKKEIYNKTSSLSDQGELLENAEVSSPIDYGSLFIENSIQDDKGKNIASSVSREYFSKKEFVGVKSKKWLYQVGKPAEIDGIVVDRKGELLSDRLIEIKAYREINYSSWIKGVDGNVSYKYETKYEDIPIDCKIKTSIQPETCSFIPQKSGYYRIEAIGKEHKSGTSIYVIGEDDINWNTRSSYLDIIPEKISYEIGETAKFMVKNPYKNAKALITIEKDNITKSWVEDFSTNMPTISFEITEEMYPYFDLEISAASPRVSKEWQLGSFDPGSPENKFGHIGITVQKKDSERMSFSIKTNKNTYKPKENVNVEVSVKQRIKDQQSELTAIVLDEAVLDLLKDGLDNFKSDDKFYGFYSHNVRTFSLLEKLITFASIPNKGSSPSGDGGGGDAVNIDIRNNIKNLAYWNGSIETDDKGNAKFSFPAPDNLTNWKIIIVAANKKGDIDTNSAEFKVTKFTEIQPAMPNQVISNDKFSAVFTVLNKMKHSREINIEISASGNISKANVIKKKITVKPFERKAITIDLQAGNVPYGQQQGNIKIMAKAWDESDNDGLEHNIPVNKYRHFDIASSYGTTLADNIKETILFPKEMRTDVGNITVYLSPTIISNLDSAVEYMKEYPYPCWEQKLSKALMAAQYNKLKQYMSVEWMESEQLIKDILETAPDYQTSKGGMTFFKPYDSFISPYLTAYTALAFIKLQELGYEIPLKVNQKVLNYLENFMNKDVDSNNYSLGMKSDIRAVTLFVLAKHKKTDKAMFERYYQYAPNMSLFGQAFLLQAAIELDVEENKKKDIVNLILAKSDETGGKFSLNEEIIGEYSRILASPKRSNCAVLSSFVAYGKTKSGNAFLRDIPSKLVRSIIGARMVKNRWENTQENIFCFNALVDYASDYEIEKPNMKLKVKLDRKRHDTREIKSFKEKIKPVIWSFSKDDPESIKKISIKKEGSGRLYYTSQIKYALDSKVEKNTNAGIEIHKEYSLETPNGWQEVTSETKLKKGDIIRVDLFLDVPSARNFVVVDDPLPGCLEAVNNQLATTSQIDNEKGTQDFAGGSIWFKFNDWTNYGLSIWSFYHQEKRFDSVRFYSDYLPPGHYYLSYVTQVIASGDFQSLPVFAGEMYNEDIYGKGISRKLYVEE